MWTWPWKREVTTGVQAPADSIGPCLLGALLGTANRTRPCCGAPFTPGNSPP